MNMEQNYNIEDIPGGVPVKMWTRGVPVEEAAKNQLANAARLPIVFKHIAAMPDVHLGIGATVGSVIPTMKAIIPAAVGVDIGCGMMAAKTTLRAEDLPDNLAPLRSAIERAVPHGRSPGARDPGSWNKVPGAVDTAWSQLEPEFTELCRDYPKLAKTNNRNHLGTLGTGNGEIHAGWVLEGRAVQDVWIFPRPGTPVTDGQEYGTTIRFFDRARGDWRSIWISPVNHVVREFRVHADGDEIFLEARTARGLPQRWIFSAVTPSSFHWRNIVSPDDGRSWRLLEDVSARRAR
jgi:hypothetical protein